MDDGLPVTVEFHSFASEIVDLSKVQAEGPVFGLVRAESSGKRAG